MSRESQDHAAALLAMDYEHFADSYWKSEQIGETRVNWLIGVATAAVGGLGYIASAGPGGVTLRVIIFATLGAVALFGLLTLFRILKRNASSTDYINALHEIRRRYRDHFDPARALGGYKPIPKRGGEGAPARTFGGLVHLVAAIVALSSGAAIGAATFPPAGRVSWWWLLLSLAFSLAAAAGVFRLLMRQIDHSEKLIRASKFTHAGGVVYRETSGAVEYLLVRPRASAKEWVLPKGHIDENETAVTAALREVREETGAVCSAEGRIGELRFEFERDGRKERISAEFYLMKLTRTEKADEDREVAWRPFPEAREALTHAEARQLLESAETLRLKKQRERESRAREAPGKKP